MGLSEEHAAGGSTMTWDFQGFSRSVVGYFVYNCEASSDNMKLVVMSEGFLGGITDRHTVSPVVEWADGTVSRTGVREIDWFGGWPARDVEQMPRSFMEGEESVGQALSSKIRSVAVCLCEWAKFVPYSASCPCTLRSPFDPPAPCS
jgi:hypothetical protein